MIKVVILAAGKGKRMGAEVPKVLVPIEGRPMIKYLLDAVFESKILIKSGKNIKPILVVSPDNIEIIKENLPEYDLDYVIQDKQLGTGHAVSCAKEKVSEADTIIVLYGDHPFLEAETICRMAKEHTGVISVLPVKLENFADWHNNFYHWGRFVRVNNEIEKIVEFKDASEEEKNILEVNPGFFCFNRKWLFENISNLKNENNQQEYYLTDMVKAAFNQKERINSIFISAHEAIGVNNVEELEVAKKVFNN
ncbi:MAG: NTP transferase domain-containing protein [Planctomycetes bacterium]|jgi:bifunctional UDP-N-acetylglucosamine pyrophosphorylase/glucosamine-1-phosphate N-acetyltransferase|nr:NTP transferase domain-containing protein [Planctomycetota bacterium]